MHLFGGTHLDPNSEDARGISLGILHYWDLNYNSINAVNETESHI